MSLGVYAEWKIDYSPSRHLRVPGEGVAQEVEAIADWHTPHGRRGGALTDIVAAYEQVQTRLSAVLLAADDAELDSPVVACPGWTVRQTCTHLIATFCESVTGRVAEMAGLDFFADLDATWARIGQMSARQVSERAAVPVEVLVDEWREALQAAGPMLRDEVPFPAPAPAFASALMINDVVVHEGDIRSALGLTPQDDEATALALGNYAFLAALRIASAGLPAISLDDGTRTTVLGQGEPAATLRASRYDLVRVLAARRAREQIRSMSWVGDPEPYVDLLPAYGVVAPTASDVV